MPENIFQWPTHSIPLVTVRLRIPVAHPKRASSCHQHSGAAYKKTNEPNAQR